MSGAYDESMIDVSSDSFWEVGNYKRTVKRVDDGNRLCNDLMSCIHERSRIEKSYAAQLTDWAKRWRTLIDKGPQYGSLELAWASLCTEAEKVSELHLEVKAALMGQDYEKLKKWQRESYHKQLIGGFKETREADDAFRKAQKPWAKKLKEVETMKKSYHSAYKEEKLAASRESNSKLENSNNPELHKKLQEKVDKCQQEAQKSKERYEKSLEELDKLTPQYMENMEQVFETWQQFEEQRISFFKELLLDVKQHLDLSTNHRFQNIYHTLHDTISATDAEEDLKWFRSNHGPGMPMNWPQFEAWSMERSVSRREKKKQQSEEEEVTLTGISHTGGSYLHHHHTVTHSDDSAPAAGSNPFEEDDDDDDDEEEEKEEEKKNVKKEETQTAVLAEKSPDWSDEEPGANPFSANGDGNPFDEDPVCAALAVSVRALYDYEGQEQDELSFRAGDEFTKTSEEDDQGWCKGRLKDGRSGLYPANYVEDILEH